MTKEAQQNQKGKCFPSNQEDDYLKTVLKKKVENNVINDQTSRNERVSNFKRMFTNQVDQNEGKNIKMLNQKVEDKTFIRGLLGTVGKSHLAESFFDKTNIKINENPDSLAQELYESIKIQQKFDNVRPNENFDYFSGVNNNNNILLGTNKEDLKNSLKIDKYQKSKFGQSIAMKNTQNNMNTYLNSVLKGNNQNFSYYDNEPIPEKKEVFSYLNSLQNTFDLKKSFYKSKNQNYSGNYFLFKIISWLIIDIISRNTDYGKLAKALTNSTNKETIEPKLKNTLEIKNTLAIKSDLHEREALGHGVYLVRSRLKEGRDNFENSKVKFINIY